MSVVRHRLSQGSEPLNPKLERVDFVFFSPQLLVDVLARLL
jgi:hypothetical protein